MIKVSDYIMEVLAERDVDRVFVLTGGLAMHLNDSLGGCSSIKAVPCLHEQSAAIAAEAQAKTSGRMGVVMVTGGPGATNAITGVAGAHLDSTPVLVLSGQVKRADMRGDSGLRNKGVQEVDIIPMVKPVTKYAVTLVDPETTRYHIGKALYLANNGRPGPVWIEIPLDVQAWQIEPDQQAGFVPDDSQDLLSEEELNAVRDLVANSKRPFVFIGNGVRLAGAGADAKRFIDHTGIPFGLSWLAADLLPGDHPRYMGRPGGLAARGANFALQTADLVLMIGCRMDLTMTAFAPERLAPHAKKVMVDIDDAELDKLRPWLAHAIRADAGEFLRRLGGCHTGDIGPWQTRCARWRNRYPLVQPAHRNPQDRVSMFHFSEVLQAASADDAIVVPTSSGVAIEILMMAYAPKSRQRFFITTALGAMGFGIPAAIGACLEGNGRQTICIEGDGGLQHNLQELQTVKNIGLPIKIFVADNDGYGSIVASQQRHFGRLMGANPESGVVLPDLEKVAALFDLPYRVIRNQQNLLQEVADILAAPGPALTRLCIRQDEVPQPRVASAMNDEGQMESRPLEDLWPFLDRDELAENLKLD